MEEFPKGNIPRFAFFLHIFENPNKKSKERDPLQRSLDIIKEIHIFFFESGPKRAQVPPICHIETDARMPLLISCYHRLHYGFCNNRVLRFSCLYALILPISSLMRCKIIIMIYSVFSKRFLGSVSLPGCLRIVWNPRNIRSTIVLLSLESIRMLLWNLQIYLHFRCFIDHIEVSLQISIFSTPHIYISHFYPHMRA